MNKIWERIGFWLGLILFYALPAGLLYKYRGFESMVTFFCFVTVIWLIDIKRNGVDK
jgi:hypothetical protein